MARAHCHRCGDQLPRDYAWGRAPCCSTCGLEADATEPKLWIRPLGAGLLGSAVALLIVNATQETALGVLVEPAMLILLPLGAWLVAIGE